jgi:myo-inositol-1(or 4)-monophosphatase
VSAAVDPKRARAAAVRAAAAAGELVLGGLGKLSGAAVRHKGAKDLVTEMDERSQELIVRLLLAEFPDHGIFAEEDITGRRDAEHVWVIDPIDGTTNYVHGYPVFCVSIALERKRPGGGSDLLAGVVHAPALGETFEAHAGGGATLNGEPIRVSAASQLIDSLLATGFACVRDDLCDDNVTIFADIVRRVQGVRRPGSAALDLAYVAAGRFDGFWELNLSPWDTAAGVLLVEEAGGQVTDFEGERRFEQKKEIVASNRVLHPAILDAIRSARARAERARVLAGGEPRAAAGGESRIASPGASAGGEAGR